MGREQIRELIVHGIETTESEATATLQKVLSSSLVVPDRLDGTAIKNLGTMVLNKWISIVRNTSIHHLNHNYHTTYYCNYTTVITTYSVVHRRLTQAREISASPLVTTTLAIVMAAGY